MPPAIASIVFWIGIGALIWLDRDREEKTSWAVWLAVVWTAIGASRALSQWMGADVGLIDSPEQYLEGSPVDRMFLTGLLVASVAVVASRGTRALSVLRSNMPLVLFLTYCAMSVLWSDYPFVAFKRWNKALGNIAVVLIILTDPKPVAAIKRFLARLSFLLVPLSVLYIKYYPALGRSYDRWLGTAYYNGVAVGKNSLGALCVVCTLASLWLFLDAVRTRPRNMARVWAHGVVLLMALWLLDKAHSATSVACVVVGAIFFVIAFYSKRRVATVNVAMGAAISLVVIAFVFPDGYGSIVGALGRDATLTGRTELWSEIVGMNPKPLIGAGFESFWLGERAEYLWAKYWWHPNQSHNGYIEIYLNLGWIGLLMLLVLVLSGYRRIIGSFRGQADTGPVMLSLFIAALLYNLTEAAVKVMHPVWIALLLSVARIPDVGREAVGTPAHEPATPERSAAPLIVPARTWMRDTNRSRTRARAGRASRYDTPDHRRKIAPGRGRSE